MSQTEAPLSIGEARIEKYTKGLLLARNHGAALRSILSGDGWRVVKFDLSYTIQILEPIVSDTLPTFTLMDLEAQKEALEFAMKHHLSSEMLMDIHHFIPQSV